MHYIYAHDQYDDRQCCSQGQKPKTKDEAKARTLKAEAEAKAWTLEAKTNTGLDPSRPRTGPSRPRPWPELLSPRPISR